MSGSEMMFRPGGSASQLDGLDFDIVRSGDGTRAIVSLAGEIDICNSGRVGGVLRSAAQETGIRDISVDLSAVEFMDCSGVSALVAAKHDLERSGIAFTVDGAQGSPLRIMELAGVTDLLSSLRPPPHGGDD